MLTVYTGVAALAVLNTFHLTLERQGEQPAVQEAPSTVTRRWRFPALGDVLRGVVWTGLAAAVFHAATGQATLPGWLLGGMAAYWLLQISALLTTWDLRRALSPLDSGTLRLFTRPLVLIAYFVVGFGTLVGAAVFWAVMLWLLLRG